jgi:hypothetical protein
MGRVGPAVETGTGEAFLYLRLHLVVGEMEDEAPDHESIDPPGVSGDEAD